MDCCVSGEPFGGRHNLITTNAILSWFSRENTTIWKGAVTAVALPPMLHRWHTHVICKNWKTIKKRINYTEVIERNVSKKSLQNNNI